MEIKHADKNSFDELTSKGLVVVDFFANWCGPCKMLGAEMEQISDRDDFSIVKVNVDDEGDLARKFGVMSIPAVFIFKDGKMVDQKVGFMSRDDLLSWVDSNK